MRPALMRVTKANCPVPHPPCEHLLPPKSPKPASSLCTIVPCTDAAEPGVQRVSKWWAAAGATSSNSSITRRPAGHNGEGRYGEGGKTGHSWEATGGGGGGGTRVWGAAPTKPTNCSMRRPARAGGSRQKRVRRATHEQLTAAHATGWHTQYAD
jgi:hypothetical protein